MEYAHLGDMDRKIRRAADIHLPVVSVKDMPMLSQTIAKNQ